MQLQSTIFNTFYGVKGPTKAEVPGAHESSKHLWVSGISESSEVLAGKCGFLDTSLELYNLTPLGWARICCLGKHLRRFKYETSWRISGPRVEHQDLSQAQAGLVLAGAACWGQFALQIYWTKPALCPSCNFQPNINTLRMDPLMRSCWVVVFYQQWPVFIIKLSCLCP